MRSSMLLCATLAVAAPPAGAAVLTFDGNICNNGVSLVACGNGQFIDQSYGDTAAINVEWRSDVLLGATQANSVRFWTSGYDDLTNVAYGQNNNNNATSVFFRPLQGDSVTLNSFRLGGFTSQLLPTQYSILDGLGNLLFSSGPIQLGLNAGPSVLFTPNITSSNGLELRWGPDSFNVGIDSIDYTLSRPTGAPVPEPATWAMMILGFASIGAGMRRRRVRAAFG